MADSPGLLVVGEAYVDLTLSSARTESKMRLGGVVHAARGLWASGVAYALAGICPKYLVDEVKDYVLAHGCTEFIWLGEVVGAPNVVVIGDVREVAYQGYEDLLRDRRVVVLNEHLDGLKSYTHILVFPGRFALEALRSAFSADAAFDFDVAYDLDHLSSLDSYRGHLRTIIVSTSSPLFAREAAEHMGGFLSQLKQLQAQWLLLKENRGGSRLFDLDSDAVECIPAQLGETVNSVGVGDVYSAVLSGLSGTHGVVEAAWRGAQVATRYAQTTYPDDLRRDTQRDAQIDLATLRTLWGTFLPWHERPKQAIYLAAPDFSYIDKPEVDRVINALQYHNFKLRRPVEEVGELSEDAPLEKRQAVFAQDIEILNDCATVLAVPIGRDPGTLVEVGWALALSKPGIIFDPRGENNNTMVVAGNAAYSTDLDECLNGLFRVLGQPCPYRV